MTKVLFSREELIKRRPLTESFVFDFTCPGAPYPIDRPDNLTFLDPIFSLNRVPGYGTV